MTSAGPTPRERADDWLKRIKFNQRPLSLERLKWWGVTILGKVLGRKVEIENSGGKSVRIFPLVWGGKIYVFGNQYENVQVDYTTPYRMRFTEVSPVTVSAGTPLRLEEKRAKASAVHVVLSHLPSEKTDPVIDYLRKLDGDYEVVLAYGGTEKNFEGIQYAKKVFVPDPKLRGVGWKQSYFGLMTNVSDYLKKAGIDSEWVFIGDYDLLPLKKDYLEDLVALLKKHEAGFGAKFIRDITRSNNFFLTNAVQEGVLGRMPALHGLGKGSVYHCLGAGLLFHRSCFEAVVEMTGDLEEMYFELAVATAAGLKDFRVLSFDEHGDYFQHVRFRPTYSWNEAVQIADAGATFVHPVKEITEFLAARKS